MIFLPGSGLRVRAELEALVESLRALLLPEEEGELEADGERRAILPDRTPRILSPEPGVLSWMVEEGARVEKGDEVARVETLGRVIPLRSPSSGRILPVRRAGDPVGWGETVALVSEEA